MPPSRAPVGLAQARNFLGLSETDDDQPLDLEAGGSENVEDAARLSGEVASRCGPGEHALALAENGLRLRAESQRVVDKEHRDALGRHGNLGETDLGKQGGPLVLVFGRRTGLVASRKGNGDSPFRLRACRTWCGRIAQRTPVNGRSFP